MGERLFIVGNGFDLAHGLPTRFEKDFKRIAESNENNKLFWELYQSSIPEIWSDFEYSLGRPDFNSLEAIFDGYAPDYSSDHESDRDAIITIVNISGNLNQSLLEFAQAAENDITHKKPLEKYSNCFRTNDVFISFNYTHTLESLYGIKKHNVLHIHGEVGNNNLLLGYPEGSYKPEKYLYDVRQKGRGPYVELDIHDFVEKMGKNEIFDNYSYEAYMSLIYKTKSFKKEFQGKFLSEFLRGRTIDEIIIIGHSCRIDFEYFISLKKTFPNTRWIFNPYNENDLKSVQRLICTLGLSKQNFIINPPTQ